MCIICLLNNKTHYFYYTTTNSTTTTSTTTTTTTTTLHVINVNFLQGLKCLLSKFQSYKSRYFSSECVRLICQILTKFECLKKFIEGDRKYEVYENPIGGDRLVSIEKADGQK